jgi:hypothetical protein
MALLEDWRAAKIELDAAQAKERDLRARVISSFSSVGPMHSGVENVPYFGGTIKIEHKLDYKLDTNTDKVDAMLDAIERSQEGGNVIAERLVKWKPEISVSEYKLLNNAQRALVTPILTIKPASKSVTFVPVVGA